MTVTLVLSLSKLEYENATLRTHLQVGNNVGNLSASRFTGGGMPESLQAEVDQHLLRAKEENDRVIIVIFHILMTRFSSSF